MRSGRTPIPRSRFTAGLLTGLLLVGLPAVIVLAQVLPVTDDSEARTIFIDPKLEAELEQNSRDLTELRSQLSATQRRLNDLDHREAEVQRDYTAVSREIELTRRLLAELNEQERMLEQKSLLLSRELKGNQQQYDHQREALARSLRAWYVRGQVEEIELILTAESLSELMVSLKYNAMLARLGAGLIDRTRGQSQHIVMAQKELDNALTTIWEGREEAVLQQDNLELLVAESTAALRDLDDERRGLKEQLLELSVNEQKLGYIINDLEQLRSEQSARTPSIVAAGADRTALSELAGQLDWPVRGEILRGFGRSIHPQFKTVTVNNGLNIGARAGSPVAAVATGEVDYADELPGYGQCVILDHGAGYYTLYAHLDQVFVSPGAEIARGQVIAEVGRPAGGEPAQLYFEVRHGRTPLDPADWLK